MQAFTDYFFLENAITDITERERYWLVIPLNFFFPVYEILMQIHLFQTMLLTAFQFYQYYVLICCIAAFPP